jgi:hypothetical protein
MVKLGREKIILSISRLCQLQMLGPIGISSSLRSAPMRMNPLHHRIQEGISPIHHDDNLLLGPRGRLSLHSQWRVQPGMESGKRTSMMSRIYLLIERVQDLPFLCARPRPTRLLHRGDRHLPLRSLLFLDYLHLEPLPPIPPLPMVPDLPYLVHHIHRPLRRFTVSARLSPIDQTPHPTATKHPPHRYTSITQSPHFDHPITSPSPALSTTQSPHFDHPFISPSPALSTTQSPHFDHPFISPSPALSTTQSPHFDHPFIFNFSASRTFSIIEGRTHFPTLHQPCIITTRILHTLHIASRHYSNLLSAFSSAACYRYRYRTTIHMPVILGFIYCPYATGSTVIPFRFYFVVLLSRTLLGTSRSRRFLYTPLRQVLCLYF